MILTYVKTQQISRIQALDLFEEKSLLQWFQIYSFQKENEDIDFETLVTPLFVSIKPVLLPEILPVPVAFASFQEHQWFKFVQVSEGKPLSSDLQEFFAIQLGVALRNYLKKTQIFVGNKNRNAVQKAQNYYSRIQYFF